MPFAQINAPAHDDAVAIPDRPSRDGLRAAALASKRPAVTQEFDGPDARFSVSLWCDGQRPHGAEHLVTEAYTSLGYRSDPATPVLLPERSATLEATLNGRTCGTLTINFDGPEGLQADTLYPEELARLRRQGDVCEFTRLALDRSACGREVLCALFYMAYAYAHRLRKVNHLVIEVNPRHEAFYRRMLGFDRGGERRLCPRVNAPAVLMQLDFTHTRAQIAKAHLNEHHACAALYRFAPPAQEEAALIRRMRIHAAT
jgi:hypothetical protein